MNIGLRDTDRVVSVVPAPEKYDTVGGTASDVATWLGNAYTSDREIIRALAKQAAGHGDALLISFPSVIDFVLGYDLSSRRFCCYVPSDHG